MDTIAGYIATIVVGLIGGYLSQFLQPRSKLICWSPHNFLFDLKEQNVVLQTNSLTLQNVGREPAECIEIVHKQKPDFFEIHPPIEFTESVLPSGAHVIKIGVLGPKSWLVLQILSYTHVPSLENLRWKHGQAEIVQIQPQRVPARWLHLSKMAVLIVGLGTLAYWFVRLGYYVATQLGWAGP